MNNRQKHALCKLFDQVRATPGVYSVGLAQNGVDLHVFVQAGVESGPIPNEVNRLRVIQHEVDFR